MGTAPEGAGPWCHTQGWNPGTRLPRQLVRGSPRKAVPEPEIRDNCVALGRLRGPKARESMHTAGSPEGGGLCFNAHPILRMRIVIDDLFTVDSEARDESDHGECHGIALPGDETLYYLISVCGLLRPARSRLRRQVTLHKVTVNSGGGQSARKRVPHRGGARKYEYMHMNYDKNGLRGRRFRHNQHHVMGQDAFGAKLTKLYMACHTDVHRPRDQKTP